MTHSCKRDGSTRHRGREYILWLSHVETHTDEWDIVIWHTYSNYSNYSLIQMQWQHPASWWRIYLIWLSHVATHIMRLSHRDMTRWCKCDGSTRHRGGECILWSSNATTHIIWVSHHRDMTHSANVMVAPGIVVLYSLTKSCRDINHMRESSWHDLLIQMRWQHPSSKWRIYCMSGSCRDKHHMSESSSWHDSLILWHNSLI